MQNKHKFSVATKQIPDSWLRCLLIFLALASVLAFPQQVLAEWVKIEDFQSYPLDNLPKDAKGWAVKDETATRAVVSADLSASGNHGVKLQRQAGTKSDEHEVLYHTGAVNIPPGKIGTVFLRFLIESGLDTTLGSTGGERPVQSVDLKIALTEQALNAGNGRAGVWINNLNSVIYGLGGPHSETVSVRRNRWYRLWLVADNTPGGQHSAAYLQEEGMDGKPTVVPGQISVPSAEAPGILTIIGMVKAKGCGLTDVWLDDVYVDNSGVNLENPLTGKAALDWKQKQEQEAKKYRRLLAKATTPEQAERQARELLAAMTAEERFALACGDGVDGILGFPRLGIPHIYFSDASAGINTDYDWVHKRHEKSVAYPCMLLLAATWNPELVQAHARCIGEECRSGGTHFLLGPSMNIYRVATCGRNLEYVGEDPWLGGRTIAAYVRGLQSSGPAATLKHFVGNEVEFHRRGSDSHIDERALNEIYFAPFRAGIEAGALGVMTSYNQLNGEWCGQSKHVITDILRGQLGFPWLVMSDWISTYDGVKVSQSGLDLEMPAGWALKKDRSKVIGTPEIDRMALNILKTCIYAGFYEPNYARPEWLAHRLQWEQAARQSNLEGITLLQNNGILPLASAQTGKTILIAGNNSTRKELSGEGSGHVKGYNLKTYVETFTEAFPAARVIHAEKPTDEQIRNADVVLLFPGFPLDGDGHEGEGMDRPFVLPDDALITRCVGINPKTVVCLTTGGGVRMDWAGQAAAILQAFYGGQTGQAALRDILTGQANPSGKLPFTIEQRIEDSPGFATTNPKPNTEHPYPAADFLDYVSFDFFQSPDKSQFYLHDVDYSEGVFVGYRWYEQKKLPVHFPFGHGLSYTTFGYQDLKLNLTGKNKVQVEFTIKNTGTRAGAEVAQVYVSDQQCSVPRPLQELKSFQKVQLKTGESRQVTLELDETAFRFWNPASKAWTVEPGEFEIRVGSSSRDIRLHATINLK
jgi:beta-glucosidase